MSASLLRTGRRRTVAAVAAGLAGAAVLAACSSSGGSSDTSSAAAPTTATASAAGGSTTSASSDSLASVCPSTIKIQTSWYPEAEKGAIYQIVGPNGTIDTNNGSYSGTVDGVTVSVLAGGPYLGNQSTIARMYSDSSILLGEVSTDDAIETAGSHPVVAVVAPMQASPKAVVYDPSVYHFKTLADVGKSGATILKAGEDASSDLLVAGGDINASQLDYSWDGSPGRFVASGGKDLIIDYATEAPYSLQHLAQWGKPMSSILLTSGGYSTYENALSVTPANETKYSACLQKFVPIMQQAFVDYAKNPTPLNNQMIKYATDAKSPTVLTAASTAFADKVMVDKGILANGSDGVAGSFDTTRVQKLIDSMSKLQAKLHTTVKSGLTAADVVTDKFLDTSIKFGGS